MTVLHDSHQKPQKQHLSSNCDATDKPESNLSSLLSKTQTKKKVCKRLFMEC